jgi:hypothetical protein
MRMMMRSFHLQNRRGEESNKEKRQVNNKESATAGKGSKGREGGKLWPKQNHVANFPTLVSPPTGGPPNEASESRFEVRR